MAVTPNQKKKYWSLRDEGYSVGQAARLAKDPKLKTAISLATAERMEKKLRETGVRDIGRYQAQKFETGKASGLRGAQVLAEQQAMTVAGPKPYDQLCDEAKRALEDFGYFRRRYFGRVSTPWQEDAGNQIVALEATEEREYVVMNEPPGSGKSTILHDLECWLICRNRGVRILHGMLSVARAERHLMRVKRALERTIPEKADEKLKERGEAYDAESTLSKDFGRFKPIERELWRNDAFIVEQMETEGSITEKEPTMTATGVDAKFMGDRFNFCFWDDIVNVRATLSSDKQEALEAQYDNEIEPRLEPAGVLCLVGQRLAVNDIYRYALDKTMPLDDEETLLDDGLTEEEVEAQRSDKKYHHIIYKAHYEDRCKPENHKRTSPAYPEGCLLDPRRLSWGHLRGIMANGEARFQVVYQQEDIAPDDVLIRKEWVYGTDGHLGCWDRDRDMWEIPYGLDLGSCIGIVTGDPSPTNYWGLEFWLVNTETQWRYLIALDNRKMEAPDFLDWNIQQERFTGLVDEWQRMSESLGIPIRYWIIEHNGAQRFLLQYNHTKTWAALHECEIIPHATHGINKTDEMLGVTVLQPHYRFGRVRLPGKGNGKALAQRLVDEATKYPFARRNDLVMAQWFLEWNLPNLVLPNQHQATSVRRPSWLRQEKSNRLFQRTVSAR